MPIVESDWAQLNPVSKATPSTVASAASIAPTSFYTVLTGNVGIATIVPPVTHAHMLALEFAGTAGVLATGNVKTAVASVVGQVMLLVFNPTTQKYVPVG